MKLTDPGLLKTACYVDGEWKSARRGETNGVRDPATDREIARVPGMSGADAREAIEAAARAFPAWSRETAQTRSKILRKWFDLMMANREDLATILTSEQGKPLEEARGEITYGASFIEWFSEEARRVYGDVIPSPAPDRRILVLKEPVGVVAAVTPWNFPCAMITRKAAAALAAGCTIVVKPARQTPLTALAMAELAHRAGLPKGVLNVVTGSSAEIGPELTGNPLVRKVTFTGSTEIGRVLMGQCASTLKRISLELGGNAPLIVFKDADLTSAVEEAVVSRFRNTGQTCVCTNRFFVADAVYEEFIQKFSKEVAALKVGNGLDPDVTQGPLIDRAALDKVVRLVGDACSRGAKAVVGGRPHARGGTFYEPTVLRDATQEMAIAREESFGPVAPVIRFRTEDEAVAMANDTEYGLASYFFTRDPGRIFRVAERLEYGMVGVNTGLLSYAVAPFGGVKQSGFGREGSKYGIEEYLSLKYVCLAGLSERAEGEGRTRSS